MITLPEPTQHPLLAIAGSKYNFHWSVRNTYEWDRREGLFYVEDCATVLGFLLDLGFTYSFERSYLPGTREILIKRNLGNKDNLCIEIVANAKIRQSVEREFRNNHPLGEMEVSAYDVLARMLASSQSSLLDKVMR